MERENVLRERTKAFALKVIRMCGTLPRNSVGRVLGQQVLRSGTSVGAHYREASRARSRAEFVSKVEGALQELEETEYWLELLTDSGTTERKCTDALLHESEELNALLTASARTAKRNDPKTLITNH